jgi:phosphoesterase RecJ-like protein
MLNEIKSVLLTHERFAVLTHIGPEGDALGAQLAMKYILDELGKKSVIISRDPVPSSLEFLPWSDSVQRPSALHGEPIDIWCIVDCGNLSRIGEDIAELLPRSPKIINIDHHRDNPRFGQVNFVKEAASTTLLMYELINFLNIKISKEVATLLYTGIIADTDSFRNANVNPTVMKTAAELLAFGVDPREVAINLYERKSPEELRLWSHVLTNAQIKNGVIWSGISKQIFRETGTHVNDTERLVEELRAVEGIEVAVLFKELDRNEVKVSLRAKGKSVVNGVARLFGGGGHEKAAGCLVEGPLTEVQDRVLAEVHRSLNANKPQ